MELKCNEISLNPQFLTANGLFPTYFELSSPEDICEQYENQGYLYLPQFLSTQKTNFLRQKYLSTFIGFKDNNVPYGTPGHPAYNFVRSQVLSILQNKSSSMSSLEYSLNPMLNS